MTIPYLSSVAFVVGHRFRFDFRMFDSLPSCEPSPATLGEPGDGCGPSLAGPGDPGSGPSSVSIGARDGCEPSSVALGEHGDDCWPLSAGSGEPGSGSSSGFQGLSAPWSLSGE